MPVAVSESVSFAWSQQEESWSNPPKANRALRKGTAALANREIGAFDAKVALERIFARPSQQRMMAELAENIRRIRNDLSTY
jgi:hypothetical protein